MATAEDALKAGDWAAAAGLYEDHGQFAQAAALHEKLLNHRAAASDHLKAGQPAEALRCAVASRDRTLEVDTLQATLGMTTQQDAATAAQLMETRHRHDVAAPLWDAAGEPEAAANAYEQAGQLAAAARRWLAVGNHRTAGQLLERHLQTSPRDLQAQLELGTVLARFGRHDAATPLFRAAAEDGKLAEAALRRLALSFAAQGHPFAAQRVLEELLMVAPDAPRDLLGLSALEESQPASREKTGLRINSRYVLLAPRSASSLGDTYLAYDEFEDRRVLLTLFKPGVAHSTSVRRFAGVTRAAGSLDSPLLVPLVEFNLAAGFLVTALPLGQPLEHWVAHGPLPDPRALMASVADALWQLHRRGLTHGALNLASIHVTLGGGVQLLDSGAGLLLQLRETESQGLQTSLATLSPEVVGGAEPSPASDQYALAAVTYFLACGTWPQPSTTARYERPSSGGAPAALDAPLARALKPRPADRFADVRQLVEALVPFTVAARASAVPSVAPPSGATRFSVDKQLPDVDAARWQVLRDTLLERPVARGEGPPGTFAVLRALAPVSFGMDRVLEVAPDGSHALLSWPAHAAAPSVDAWIPVARALAALHDAALSLGPDRAHALRGAHLQLHGRPMPVAGGPAAQREDVALLRQRITESTGVHLPDALTDAHTVAHALETLQDHHAVEDVAEHGAQLMDTAQTHDAQELWASLKTLVLERS